MRTMVDLQSLFMGIVSSGLLLGILNLLSDRRGRGARATKDDAEAAASLAEADLSSVQAAERTVALIRTDNDRLRVEFDERIAVLRGEVNGLRELIAVERLDAQGRERDLRQEVEAERSRARDREAELRERADELYEHAAIVSRLLNSTREDNEALRGALRDLWEFVSEHTDNGASLSAFGLTEKDLEPRPQGD